MIDWSENSSPGEGLRPHNYKADAELWQAKYEKLKNESDRKVRSLIDEQERRFATEAHLYAVIDRLRWALKLCKDKMKDEDWDDDIHRFAESR